MKLAIVLIALAAIVENDDALLVNSKLYIRRPSARLEASRQVPKTEYYSLGGKRGTFNSGKKYMSNEEKMRQVDKVLTACRNKGKPVVSITDVNYAITTAGRGKRFADAYEMFRSLDRLGLEPDLMSYNNMIWSAGNVGKFDLAKQLFNELQERPNLHPNVYTYGALLHGCAKVKGYKQALAYLDRMDYEGIKPNQIVFTSAMEGERKD